MSTSPLDYLQAGLRATSLRQTVIANNIANINTPGYRRSEVQFEALLAETIKSGQIDLEHLQPQVYQPRTDPVDANGNDVSLDVEVGELVKNSGMYKAYFKLLSKLVSQMELAING